MEIWALIPLAGIFAFFGTICYGIHVLSSAISGRLHRSKELEALRAEVTQIRQELASTLYTQDDEIQRLEQRVRSVEQALPALRAGAAEEAAARVRLQGP